MAKSAKACGYEPQDWGFESLRGRIFSQVGVLEALEILENKRTRSLWDEGRVGVLEALEFLKKTSTRVPF